MRVATVRGFALSARLTNGPALGLPEGLKSLGMVEVTTTSGLTGYGETYAGVYAPGLIEPVTKFLAERLVGQPADRHAFARALETVPFVARTGIVQSIASAIDIALADIEAQEAGMPMCELLGGVRDVPAYASGGSARAAPDEVRSDIERARALGFRAFKMRVGYLPWEQDLERLTAAREALGSTRDLMVDAIMGTIHPSWDAETAIARAHEMKRFDLRWLEEPVRPEDLRSLARVRAAVPMDVAAGESWASVDEFDTAIAMGAADILQPDVTQIGGVTRGEKVAALAAAADLPMAIHVWGGPVAIAANTHFAAATPGVEIVEVPMLGLDIVEQLGGGPPTLRDGKVRPLAGPGLGLDLSSEALAKFSHVAGTAYRMPARSAP